MNFETLHSKELHKKISKKFGHLLGQPVQPRPAGPTLFCFGQEQQGIRSIACTWSKGKRTSTERAKVKPFGPIQAGRPPCAVHIPSPLKVALPPGVARSVPRRSRPAYPRPAGLAPAPLYKNQRWRRSSVHQKLRFACLSPSSSISSPFSEFLCLIKFF